MRVGFLLASLVTALSCLIPITVHAHGRHDFRGSEGGVVSAIVTTPAHPSTLYAATSQAGVFKTLDGGNHWVPVNRGLNRVDVLALVQDPRTPGVLIAGTRDGVYKTVDGAAHWSRVDAMIGDGPIKVLAFDAAAHRLYAGTSQGIWKSDDAGAAWSQLPVQPANRNITALTIAHDSAQSIYAGTAEGLFRSQDQGATWRPISKGLSVPSIATFALDPSRPNVLYVGSGDGAYKSEDNGETWHIITGGQTNLPVTALLVDPRRPDTLYMGTSFVGGLFKSSDAGKSWQRIQGEAFTPAFTALAFPSADTDHLIAGSSYFTSIFNSHDGGSTWKSTAGPLAFPELESITGTPDGGALFAAAPDGVYQFDSAQQQWKWLGNAGAGKLVKVVYSKRSGGRLWACGEKGVAEAQARNGTWRFAKRLALNANCLDLVEDVNSGRLVAADKTGILVGPGTWQRRALPAGIAPDEHIKLEARNGGLYVLSEHRVLRSNDAGKHWETFADDPSSVFTAMATAGPGPSIWMATDSSITHRTADGKSTDISEGVFPPGIGAMAAAADGSHVYAASGVLGRLFTRATDQRMWSSTDLEDGAPEVSGLWVDPTHHGVLYASTRNSGMFRSDDHGQHWAAMNAGLEMQRRGVKAPQATKIAQ